MSLPTFHNLTVFIATSADRVPDGCRRYYSVDGSVPGAFATWDHHATGEPINLDAMPNIIDPASDRIDGVGSTNADVDALSSVVVVMFGGKARVPPASLAVLASASHWCDHLVPHPGYDEQVNKQGRGLLDALNERLSNGPWKQVSERFAEVSREVAGLIADGTPLPQSDAAERHREVAANLLAEGRITEHGPVALFDLRDAPSVDPYATYSLTTCPVGVAIENHPRGGNKFTVGINPTVPSHPTDLRDLLATLAREEWQHGAPAKGPEPIPNNENWGGRASVFGSPWNYGSRLTPEHVVEVVRRWMKDM